MTLDEICDDLERWVSVAENDAVKSVDITQPESAGPFMLCRAAHKGLLFEHLVVLVDLGRTKLPENTRWSSEFRETCERFRALEKRTAEALP